MTPSPPRSALAPGLAAAAALALVSPLLAAPGRRAPPAVKKPPAVRPAPEPMPGPMAIARVEVAFRADAALVTTDVTFARGAYLTGDRELFVAYGSPGVPLSFAAESLAVDEGRFSPPPAARGQALESFHAQRAPPEASFALGPHSFAGQRILLPGPRIAEALSTSGLGALRLRAVVSLAAAAGERRSVLVRISSSSAAPLPLGVVTARGDGLTLSSASASLCGGPGGEIPLALGGKRATPPLLPPPRAPRAPGDELCVRAALAAETPRPSD